MGEDHEVVFVVASDAAEAKALARSKWSGSGRGHVDAVRRLDQVDGFQLSLAKVDEGGDRTVLDSYN